MNTRSRAGAPTKHAAATPGLNTSHPIIAAAPQDPTLATTSQDCDTVQNIHSQIAQDIKNISEEGKTILNCIIKAFQVFFQQKDTKIEQSAVK